jgi:hypothetical protein
MHCTQEPYSQYEVVLPQSLSDKHCWLELHSWVVDSSEVPPGQSPVDDAQQASEEVEAYPVGQKEKDTEEHAAHVAVAVLQYS